MGSSNENNILICFLFKIITGKLRGILGLSTSLVYEEFVELSAPAMFSRLLMDVGGCANPGPVQTFCPISSSPALSHHLARSFPLFSLSQAVHS